MRDRSFSEEERKQREKEERSRLRKQEQAYREAQRGVYSRIYQEQDAMPEDYRQAFWEDPRDRLYDRDPLLDWEETDDGWEDQRRQIQQEALWDDPWPQRGNNGSRRNWREDTLPQQPQAPRRQRSEPPEPEDQPGGQWQPVQELENQGDDEWQPILSPRASEEPPHPRKKRPGPPPAKPQGSGGRRPPSGRTPPSRPSPGAASPGKGRKRRKILVTVLVVLLALVAAGFIVHQIFVRPPEQPTAENQSSGTDPGNLGAGRKEGVYTFLLVGRDDGGGGNTDTMMVGCYDVNNGTLDVLSIYRDTLVDVPWEIAKINSVYNRQGIEGVREQVKNLIGYAPDYYFVVELDAVAELVDAIGGVDYEVPYNMDYDDPTQDLHIHYKKGMQHLEGEDAVKVLRWRKNNSGESLSVGDVGRVEVQHTFLRALAGEMISLGTLTKIGEIVDVVDRNLDSNLKYGEMIWFGERALMMGKENIRFHNLPGDYTGSLWSPTYQNYQSYVFVNSSALRELVNQYMNPYLTDITSDMQNVVHDTTVNNLPVEDNGTTGISGDVSTQSTVE